jgi:hypothetical protein
VPALEAVESGVAGDSTVFLLFVRLAHAATVALLAWSADTHGHAQQAAAFENERVAIWRVEPGVPRRPAAHASLPGVLVSLADGAVRVADRMDALVAGQVTNPGGAILIAVKTRRAAPLEPPPGIPAAFPRDGARRIAETSRVSVWEVSWSRGMTTPLHFHDKDVVAVYLGAGTVRTIPRDGPPTATPRKAGEAIFLQGGRVHVEECIDGPRRDIIVELK